MSHNGVPGLASGAHKTSGRLGIALCLPWYDGPDIHCFDEHFAHLHYYGRMQERGYVRDVLVQKIGPTLTTEVLASLPPLDPVSETQHAEWLPTDPTFEWSAWPELKNSLVGHAREACVDKALAWGADYCFFFDNDIKFAKETFLRLYRHDLPVVYALAFTAREPTGPVIFKFQSTFNPTTRESTVNMEWQPHYPKNTVFRVDAAGGGVMLIKAEVFKTIPKPWFASTGCGEDILFCTRCEEYGIPRFMDSSIWTAHKPNKPLLWHDERYYEAQRPTREQLHEMVNQQVAHTRMEPTR